jgi:hypothetical protein
MLWISLDEVLQLIVMEYNYPQDTGFPEDDLYQLYKDFGAHHAPRSHLLDQVYNLNNSYPNI